MHRGGGRRERSSIPCATRAWERPRNAGCGIMVRSCCRADSAAAPPPLFAGPTMHRLHCVWAPPASLLSSSAEQRPSHCASFSFPFSSCGGGLGFGEGLGTAESRRRGSPAEAEEAAGGAPAPALVGAAVVPAHSRRDAGSLLHCLGFLQTIGKF